MIRKLRLIFLILLILTATSGIAFASANASITQSDIQAGLLFCKANPVSCNVNGKTIISDVPPVIVKDRTLIPARSVFEAMGGKVNWDDSEQSVTVEIDGKTVKMKIGSSVASVNDKDQVVEMPATIINGRTMVPLRFISESVGSTVGWENDTRTVNITYQKASITSSTATVNPIKLTENTSEYKITISADKRITYQTFSLDNPNRFVMDICDAKIISSQNIATVNTGIVKCARISQNNTNAVRMVTDLSVLATPKIIASQDGKTLSIVFARQSSASGPSTSNYSETDIDDATFTVTGDIVNIRSGPDTSYALVGQVKLGDILTASESSSNRWYKVQSDNNLTGWISGMYVDAADAISRGTDIRATDTSREKLIIVDAGHGGSDTGAIGPDNNYEKDATLAIALKLSSYIEASGYRVIMTREEDKYISLLGRSAIANNANADLFIAIHCNASINHSSGGTETLFEPMSGNPVYKKQEDSERLATLVHIEMMEALGLSDRGVNEQDLSVCRNTDAPAILVETAFIDNVDEVKLLLDPMFQDKAAKAIAQGVNNYFAK